MVQENPLIYFDLSLGRYGNGTPLGRVVVELKEDAVPKTAKNFLELAESRQVGNGYKGSRAHRIIPGTASTFSWYPLHWYVPKSSCLALDPNLVSHHDTRYDGERSPGCAGFMVQAGVSFCYFLPVLHDTGNAGHNYKDMSSM